MSALDTSTNLPATANEPSPANVPAESIGEEMVSFPLRASTRHGSNWHALIEEANQYAALGDYGGLASQIKDAGLDPQTAQRVLAEWVNQQNGGQFTPPPQAGLNRADVEKLLADSGFLEE